MSDVGRRNVENYESDHREVMSSDTFVYKDNILNWVHKVYEAFRVNSDYEDVCYVIVHEIVVFSKYSTNSVSNFYVFYDILSHNIESSVWVSDSNCLVSLNICSTVSKRLVCYIDIFLYCRIFCSLVHDSNTNYIHRDDFNSCIYVVVNEGDMNSSY